MNPVKIEATHEAFVKVFGDGVSIKAKPIESHVSDQPITSDETFTGASNRVNNAIKAFPNYDYWIGIEAGVEKYDNMLASFTWVVVKSRDNRIGSAKSQTYFLPKKVSDQINKGKELGEAVDTVFNKKNSKQNNGAIGILTNNLMNRKSIYIENIILALIPFMHSDHF
jgi:inosine/xanthosine triphosphatase